MEIALTSIPRSILRFENHFSILIFASVVSCGANAQRIEVEAGYLCRASDSKSEVFVDAKKIDLVRNSVCRQVEVKIPTLLAVHRCTNKDGIVSFSNSTPLKIEESSCKPI